MNKTSGKQRLLFAAGVMMIAAGCAVLGFFGIRKLWRIAQKEKLIRENASLVIEALDIRAPVLEGTGNAVLRQAAGHFPDTGGFGKGNYCIAAHSSTLYKEYFNNLKHAETGMEIRLYNREKQCYTYLISDMFIVNPDETWILDDFGDDRITLVTCTDDGTQRRIVVGRLQTGEGE